ncbi:MAG: hypothetical protein HYX25_02040 [Candidatus Solibacter usitatus]|nr:hypothetical protein [Candidatus Solibacter usitatus]
MSAAGVLCIYAAFSFSMAQQERNLASSDPYKIGAQEERFAALKRELPANSVVGYVSDVSQPAVLSAAQYGLAPVLVVDNARREWVVGNFSRPLDYAEFGRARQLTLVKEFSNGVILYRKSGS